MGEINEDREKRHARMLETISKGRTPLASHLLEDEAVRLASEETSREYLVKCEEEKNDFPTWMWYLMFFILGYLMCLSEPATFYLVWNLIK